MACDRDHRFQPNETAMRLRRVSFAYNGKAALREVSLDFAAGRLTGLLGPNGAGKTTLFKCCLGFLAPGGGTIELGGAPLASYARRHLARHIAYVPQQHQAVFPFSVREMVAMGRHARRGVRLGLSAGDREAVAHAMDRVGIAGLAERNFHHLSGGQRQLVLVARALAQEADLLFLDEPTASLDFNNQVTVWQTLRTIVAAGVGAVVCCHDPNHILWFCDEAAAMKDGMVVANGPPRASITPALLEELYERPVRTASLGERIFVFPGA